MVEFANLTKEEHVTLLRPVLRRAYVLLSIETELNPDFYVELEMDLLAIHFHTPLDFKTLLATDNGNFLHGITGIQSNIDRETGLLLNCFHPRTTVKSK